MPTEKESLYELTPQEFEQLCADILRAQQLQHVELVGGPADQGVDIIGQSEGRTVVVQVKHTKRLAPSTIRTSIERMLASSYQPKRVIFITSAPLLPSHREAIQGLSSDIAVQLMGQADVLEALKQNPGIA